MRRHSLLCFALLLGLGCASVTDPFTDVRVTTTVEPRSNLADPVSITTTVINDATRAVTVETNPCPVRFRVETPAGVRVGPPGQICTAISQPITLAPGQSFSFHDQWNGTDSNGARVSGAFRVIGQPFYEQGPQSAPVSVFIPE